MKIAIIGAGLMGQTLALRLLQQGDFAVSLRDDGQPSVALSAAGMIAPFAELDRAEWPIAELGAASLAAWPALLKTLDEPVYFQRKGALVCAHPQDQAELTHYYRKIKRHSQTIPCEHLQSAEIQQLEPELTAVNQAYYFPDEGQIDCQQVLGAMKNFLNSKGIFNDCSGDFDYTIDCRGLNAKSVFTDLRGIRGEVVWLQSVDVTLTRPIRLLHPRYSIYIVPRPNNIYIVGASEIEAQDNSPISVRSLMELLSAAYSLHKGFIEARVIHTMTNCRPTLTDHLPKIKYQPKKIAINGLYRHGFSLAPALADEVIRFLQHGDVARAYPYLWEQ